MAETNEMPFTDQSRILGALVKRLGPFQVTQEQMDAVKDIMIDEIYPGIFQVNVETI